MNTTMRVMLVTLLAVTPAAAQSNNQSDVTGPTVTTSDVAPNSFTPTSNTSTVNFTSPGVATTVSQNLNQVQAQLTQATLAPSSAVQAAVPAPVQNALANVLSCSSACGAAVQQVAAGLSTNAAGSAGAPPAALAVELTQALQGLTDASTISNPQVLAVQLQRASTAFSALIESAGESYLRNPPPELIATHAVLTAALNGAAGR